MAARKMAARKVVAKKTAAKKPVARKKSDEFNLERSLSHLLRRTQQFAYDQFVQQMGSSSLTPRQFVVLFAVDEEQGLSQTDLVNRTGIDRSTLADMISRMIKAGLLARKRTATDARANAVRLTAAGRRALKAAMPRALAAEQLLMSFLPKAAQTQVVHALGLLADAIQSAKEEEKGAAKKPATRKKTAAKKPAAKKAARAKKKATPKRTSTTRKPAARKAPARKPAAKRTARKQSPRKRA